MAKDDRLIRAVQSATQKLASSGNFNLLMRDVLAICVEAVGASGGTIYLHDAPSERLRFQHVLPEEILDKLPTLDIPDDFGMAGTAFQSRQTQVRTFPKRAPDDWSEFEKATGVELRSMVATPLAIDEMPPIGVVQLINKKDGEFGESDCAVLDIVSSVSTMAYLNFKLTEESARASTLLGMGKVSHDIGNLAAALHANLSFSDLAMHGMREHLESAHVDQQMMDYFQALEPMFGDIKSSVDRIVGYSRLISDMSAGRTLRPDMRLAPMAETIRTSAAYLETEGRANHVGIRYDIDEDAPPTLHDELYVFRIVQNLVGNAIKAVREVIPEDWQVLGECEDEPSIYGEVLVRYCFDGESHIVEVRDSGPGMSRDIAAKILSGNARSHWDKAGGSGWGMKIVLELAATHNGKVTIDSSPGHGATFRIAFPHTPVTI